MNTIDHEDGWTEYTTEEPLAWHHCWCISSAHRYPEEHFYISEWQNQYLLVMWRKVSGYYLKTPEIIAGPFDTLEAAKLAYIIVQETLPAY